MGQGWFMNALLLLALVLVQSWDAAAQTRDPQQAVTVTGYLVELDCMTIQNGSTLELLHRTGCVRGVRAHTARFAIMVRNDAHTVYNLDKGANARLIKKFSGMLEDHHNVVITVIGSLEKNKAISVSWIGEPELEGATK